MLQRELLQDGYITEIISWQDETVNYSEYECLILRSVWGYQDHYPQFKKWLLSLKENNIPIYNNVDIILDNIRKDKQFEILDINPHFYSVVAQGLKKPKQLSVNGKDTFARILIKRK